MNAEPIRNLGPWSFTIQNDTPVHWLKTGPLESYLLKFNVDAWLVDGVRNMIQGMRTQGWLMG